jgi:hypothetical protein
MVSVSTSELRAEQARGEALLARWPLVSDWIQSAVVYPTL